jgi:hypothetical protein
MIKCKYCNEKLESCIDSYKHICNKKIYADNNGIWKNNPRRKDRARL